MFTISRPTLSEVQWVDGAMTPPPVGFRATRFGRAGLFIGGEAGKRVFWRKRLGFWALLQFMVAPMIGSEDADPETGRVWHAAPIRKRAAIFHEARLSTRATINGMHELDRDSWRQPRRPPGSPGAFFDHEIQF